MSTDLDPAPTGEHLESSSEATIIDRKDAFPKPSKTTLPNEGREAPGSLSFFRSFKLQVLAYPDAWTCGSEPRKVAIRKSRRVATFHALLHLIPLFAAVVLMGINWCEYYLGPNFTSSTALQFVAKFHEILMQASLGEVLLCVLRTLAINECVPLGALSAAMQTYQISYLWSLEFISAIRSNAFRGWSKAIFIIGTISVLALMTTVGPSSAVLMIPRPNQLGTIESVILYGPTYESQMPSHVNSTYSSDRNFESFTDGFMFYHTRDDIGTVSKTFTDTHDDSIQRQLRYTTSRRRALSNESYNPKYDYFSTVATLPTRISAHTLKYAAENFPRRSNYTILSRSPRPVVFTRCTPSLDLKDYSSREFSLPYIKDTGNSSGSLPTHSQLLQSQIGDTSFRELRLDQVPPTWLPSPEINSSSLIGVLPHFETMCFLKDHDISNVPLFTDVFSEAANKSTTGCYSIMVCTISSFWDSSEQEYVFNEGTSIVRTSPLPDTGFNSPYEQYTYPIHLNLSGFPFFNKPNFFFQKLPPPEPLLAAMITTLLAEVPNPSSTQWYFQKIYDRHTPYQFYMKQYGYGYGISSTSVQLSLTVMLAYCTIVLGYIAYTMTTGYTSTAWNTAIEFVMLALHSQAPRHMGHTSVGINSMKTYQRAVGIRVNYKDELELAFVDDDDMGGRDFSKIVPNKAY